MPLSHVYEGDGNRVAETVGGVTTKFLVDSLNPTKLPQVMDELVGTTVTRTYAYGVQRISEDQQIRGTWTPSFYGYDGHGNVRYLTGNTGTITDRYTYDAFGMPVTTVGATPNSFLYSGEQYDGALGAYYLRARYYNPATGRLLAMDPYEGEPSDPVTLHKYSYAQNDPVNVIDPTGRAAVVEVAFMYVRNNYGVLASARVRFDPLKLRNAGVGLLNFLGELEEVKENASFASKIGYCDAVIVMLRCNRVLMIRLPMTSSMSSRSSNCCCAVSAGANSSWDKNGLADS